MQTFSRSGVHNTHPLGERDSWPATGPIYDIAARKPSLADQPTFWERLLPPSRQSQVDASPASDSAPVWY